MSSQLMKTVMVFKIKSLKPSMQEKKRYLMYEIISDKPVTNPKKDIYNTLLKYLGVFGYAKAGIMFVTYKNNKGILKVGHKHVNELKAALMMTKKINNQNVIVKSIKTSGILKKVKEAF